MSALDTMKAAVQCAKTEAAALRIDNANLKQRVKEMRAELDQFAANAKSVAKAHADQEATLRGRVRDLEEKLVDAAAVSEREADGLRQGADVLVTENARLVAANTRQSERIASLEASVTSLEDRLRGERAAADTFLAANTPLRARVAALEKQLSGMKEGLRNAQERGCITLDVPECEGCGPLRAACVAAGVPILPHPESAPAVTGTPSDKPDTIRKLCQIPSSITGAACTLPEGHPPDNPTRFHRYAPPTEVDHG